ncbi:MAG: tetratricopeptide repeat protein [Bacteroidales bacterium]|nr:tetratricopeptide repeat protein [Bacteroidales bacterium]
MKKILTLMLVVLCLSSCDKTRQYTRKGNKMYNKKEYAKAQQSYSDALKEDSVFSAANFNMGNAVMQDKDSNFQQAVEYYNKYLDKKPGNTKKDKLNYSKGLYNRGNALFALSQQDNASEQGMKYLQQAATDYKNAMLLNPSDTDARYNYALCLWLLKNNNQSNNGNNNQNNNSSNSEINQMLEAMKNNEKNIISKVKKHKENLQNQRNEKDW